MNRLRSHWGFILLVGVLWIWFSAPVSAQKTLVAQGLTWHIVDDPSPSAPSDWAVTTNESKDEVISQRSNIYRTEREYEFWQGTHIWGGYSSGMSDYNWGFDCRSDDDDGWGAIIRYQDENNYYRFITVQDSTNGGPFRRLEKFVNGVRTVLDEKKEGFVPGKVHLFRMSAFKDQIKVYLDKELILSAKDTTFSKGMMGLLTYADSGFSAWHLSHWLTDRP